MTNATPCARRNDGATPFPAFRKTLTAARARAEVRGWQAVSSYLTVPLLLGHERLGDAEVVSYEHVFSSGRCQLLLGDLIGLADRGAVDVSQVEAMIDGICQSLCTAADRTGALMPLAGCVPALYSDRIRPGGRLDQWYLPARQTPGTAYGPPQACLRHLRGWRLHANGTARDLDLAAIIRNAREALDPARLWQTAITQGDPTEPNIAVPLCWLDFEHAGRSVLAGDAANLLWYLLGMGGWLVPRYQPDTYARTLRLALPPVTSPALTRADISAERRCADISYTWHVGRGRAAALNRLLAWLDGGLGDAIGESAGRLATLLRPFLVLRILGVIPVASMTRRDCLLGLAKLTEACDPEVTLRQFAQIAASDHAAEAP
jgi:hypothetical protein